MWVWVAMRCFFDVDCTSSILIVAATAAAAAAGFCAFLSVTFSLSVRRQLAAGPRAATGRQGCGELKGEGQAESSRRAAAPGCGGATAVGLRSGGDFGERGYGLDTFFLFELCGRETSV
jgi:hypothetical protein